MAIMRMHCLSKLKMTLEGGYDVGGKAVLEKK